MPEENDNGINVKSLFGNVALWSPQWLAGESFVVRKAYVKMGGYLTSDDAMSIAFPKVERIAEKTDAEMEAFFGTRRRMTRYSRSAWTLREIALFLAPDGSAAWFDTAMVDRFDVGALWAASPDGPFLSDEDAKVAWLGLMPMKVHVTKTEWDEIGKAMAAALNPEPAPASDHAESVMDALMAGLRDAGSDIAQTIRPKKGSGIDSVTLSHGGESVTLTAE